MNDFDLQAELNRNASDKQIVGAELEASRNKWADYVIQRKEEICAYTQPIVVKKKKSAKFRDFVNKIKIIFGLAPRKEQTDGIEAYLQYRDDVE